LEGIVEIGTPESMSSSELSHASGFVGRLAAYWPEGEHLATRRLLGELADALARQQLEIDLLIAKLEVAHADDWSTRVALGLADPNRPPPLGWTGERGTDVPPVADATSKPDKPQVSDPDDAQPVADASPEPDDP
jgi:hypothetical protein